MYDITSKDATAQRCCMQLDAVCTYSTLEDVVIRYEESECREHDDLRRVNTVALALLGDGHPNSHVTDANAG